MNTTKMNPISSIHSISDGILFHITSYLDDKDQHRFTCTNTIYGKKLLQKGNNQTTQLKIRRALEKTTHLVNTSIIADFPSHIFYHITEYLDEADIVRFSCTNKKYWTWSCQNKSSAFSIRRRICEEIFNKVIQFEKKLNEKENQIYFYQEAHLFEKVLKKQSHLQKKADLKTRISPKPFKIDLNGSDFSILKMLALLYKYVPISPIRGPQQLLQNVRISWAYLQSSFPQSSIKLIQKQVDDPDPVCDVILPGLCDNAAVAYTTIQNEIMRLYLLVMSNFFKKRESQM